MTVEAVKSSLYLAATGAESPHQEDAWEKGGTERMEFEHPRHRFILGSVELDTTISDPQQVRLELVIPPDVAGKVIQMLMAEPDELRIPVSVTPVAAVEVVEIPPTRDPSEDDLAEMAAEEAEVGLPPEVCSVFPSVGAL
jgi:hypothetical protein